VKQAKGILPQSVLDQAKEAAIRGRVDALSGSRHEDATCSSRSTTSCARRAAHLEDMKRNGYAPLQRFGQYTVNATVDGERSFTMHESEREANKFARALREMGSTDVSRASCRRTRGSCSRA
jgi:hypothetical protein